MTEAEPKRYHVPLVKLNGRPIIGLKRCANCGLSETYWNRFPDCEHSPVPDAVAKGYIGPCPKCGTQLGFGHLPEKCNGKLIAPAPAEGAALLGMPVRLDDSMPKGTVELRNASGELLGKIENIGAPAEGAEQFWKNYVPQYGDTRPRYVQVMESYADREVASLREQLEKWMRDYAIKTELLDEAEEQLAREKELHFAANGLKECFAKALENVKEQLAQAQRERDEYKAMLARLPDAMVEHLKHSLARTSGGGEK